MGAGGSCSRNSSSKTHGWPAGNESDYVEDVMREVSVFEDRKVLVVQSKGRFFGLGSHCTHYGANLAQGVCSDGKITCPWHGACFNVETGDIEDFPGVDGIPTYKVTQESNGDLFVHCPNKLQHKAVMPIRKFKTSNSTFVIIGAGPGGFMAAQTLRQNKFDGRIVMISKGSERPFDKTRLSKDFIPKLFHLELKDYKFYEDNAIELLRSQDVTSVDFATKMVYMKGRDGTDSIYYDKLLIATGSSTRTLHGIIGGGELLNILRLNSYYTDVIRLYGMFRDPPSQTFIIIGATLVGLELCSNIASRCVKVILIGSRAQPLGNLVGPTVSSAISAAMDLIPNLVYLAPDSVTSFIGNEAGAVKAVVTLNNGTINCDGVILAMLPQPNTGFLDPSKIMKNVQTGAIVVSSNMQSSVEDVYGAGDVVEFPFDNCSNGSGKGRSETWNVAAFHGKVAALNMLGIDTSVSNAVPFLWSDMFGLYLRIVGDIKGADSILVYSKCASEEGRPVCFCSVFMLNSEIVGAVTTSDSDPIASRIAANLRSKRVKLLSIESYLKEIFPADPFIETLPK